MRTRPKRFCGDARIDMEQELAAGVSRKQFEPLVIVPFSRCRGPSTCSAGASVWIS